MTFPSKYHAPAFLEAVPTCSDHGKCYLGPSPRVKAWTYGSVDFRRDVRVRVLQRFALARAN